ncbi:hypothetical protein MPSEU_001018300 [Mayamaea pseudoterrestris]|nr:hypothetical protein MPSEU_001018300 [Mayamaea pseudoterrestris]
MNAATTATAKAATKIPFTSSIGWALSGWALFVAENAVLSENRTFLIDQLGDDPYHWLYGTCSTAAMGSIGYSYYYLRKRQQQQASSVASAVTRFGLLRHPIVAMAASWTSLTLGLVLALQGLPAMQVPISPTTMQVRCPFDFAPRQGSQETNAADPSACLFGLERITRHPGLWSFGLIGLGNAALHPAGAPLRLWWMGPALVAWLGGSHTDSRYRRNLGGSMDPHYDSVTSNLPFAATLTGKQGPVGSSLSKIIEELKPLNAGLGALIATVWVVSRGRLRL